ncbi:putative nucleoside-diphosphate-sugar epimerases [Aspergillus glaucus CBS 516.65]|uniref:NAD(P)-binding domain-containing protein n=1 Tax=Aspergillus glaucus CBS 516.65 TaxID=1160497 RepID=A0A1L9VMZ0_ASPGL|nr:hypothetical protein ASPGLDRAFT_25116 [Aspergillus glaucus CBS 516.65]OJJ85285.1 hypothetical protein ASPGLDRAFT_25116 [Aspergillus glaucus CBS 516.65]
MHVILTGATGLVGSTTLLALMGMKDIAKISILSRRPVPMVDAMKDERVEVIIHDNFEKYDTALLERLRGANGCVWALGISQNAVAKEEYIRITKSMTLEAAQAFGKIKPDSGDFNFVFVSGEGATREPGFFTPLFGRVKGETEIALMELEKKIPHFRPVIVRPAMVDSKDHDALRQWIPPATGLKGLAESIFGPIIRSSLKTMHSPTKPLGWSLAQLATGSLDGGMKGEGIEVSGRTATVTNIGFRKLMHLQ